MIVTEYATLCSCLHTLQVRLLKCLNHPNILHFIGILVREGKNLVLITEYADGGTLRKTIKNVVSYMCYTYECTDQDPTVSWTCEFNDLYLANNTFRVDHQNPDVFL